MMRRSALVRSAARGLAGLVLLGVAVGGVGCQGFGSTNGFGATVYNDDIVAIRGFYNPLPWVRDADDRITGFCVRTYFISGRTDKGVFVPGPITAKISRLHPRLEGGYDRTLLHEWTFHEYDARTFRVQKPSIMGDSYGFVLRWPDELDVMGRTIEIVFSYRRSDGRVITGPTRQLKVLLPPGYPSPSDEERPSGASPAVQLRRPADGAGPGRE